MSIYDTREGHSADIHVYLNEDTETCVLVLDDGSVSLMISRVNPGVSIGYAQPAVARKVLERMLAQLDREEHDAYLERGTCKAIACEYCDTREA